MEENKDFQESKEEKKFNETPNLDELVKSIEDNSGSSVQEIEQETEPVEHSNEKPKFEGYKTNTLFFSFMSIFGVVFLTIFFMFNVYLRPMSVVGQSMLPTINAQTLSNYDKENNDLVYYRQKESYNYGDIVIISNETDQYIENNNRTDRVDFLIKRIIACPGDTITFFLTDIDSEKHLYYYDIIVKNPNGQIVELNEKSYIYEPMYQYFDHSNPFIFNDFYAVIMPNIINDSITDPANRKTTITISNGCYFAMGDNRNHSSDSRSFGEVKVEDICGNVRLHVKNGETVWDPIFRKIKSYLSVSYKYLKENLWKNY